MIPIYVRSQRCPKMVDNSLKKKVSVENVKKRHHDEQPPISMQYQVHYFQFKQTTDVTTTTNYCLLSSLTVSPHRYEVTKAAEHQVDSAGREQVRDGNKWCSFGKSLGPDPTAVQYYLESVLYYSTVHTMNQGMPSMLPAGYAIPISSGTPGCFSPSTRQYPVQEQ